MQRAADCSTCACQSMRLSRATPWVKTCSQHLACAELRNIMVPLLSGVRRALRNALSRESDEDVSRVSWLVGRKKGKNTGQQEPSGRSRHPTTTEEPDTRKPGGETTVGEEPMGLRGGHQTALKHITYTVQSLKP